MSKMNEESEERKELGTSVKVNHIWNDILMTPIYGTIDSQKAQEIMEKMLQEIENTGAKAIILDIIGVAAVDSAVANHIIKIKDATHLMGCRCVISGMSPGVAQAIVNLGIDLGDIYTRTTLKDALELAFYFSGLEVKPINE